MSLLMHNPSYLPSPEEIREMCRVIQGEWSTEQRIKRAAHKSCWRPPVLKAALATLGIERSASLSY